MNKSIAAATVAASLTIGGLAGAALGAPGLAGATGSTAGVATTAADGAGWVQDALSRLVTDGTITQEQADAVESALQDARPERRHHGDRHIARPVVAEALGITEEELRSARRDGLTVAEIAEAEGVDAQVVIDAVLADLESRLDDRIAAGDLTRERADEILTEAAERIEAFVDGDTPPVGGGPRRGGR